MSAEPIVRWWESPEYVAAERAQERASWATVCHVAAGDIAGAQQEAAKALTAQAELQRLTPP